MFTHRYDPVLEVVVTYTTELALEQAQAADDLIKRGKYQGVPLSVSQPKCNGGQMI